MVYVRSERRCLRTIRPPARGRSDVTNVILRYLKLTRERFPRLSVVRKVLPDGARYLGPFPSGGLAELVKAAIEDALPLRRCTARIGANGGGSPCALLELRRCLGPCTGRVPPEVYAALVGRLEAALDGDPAALLAPLRQRMAGYAAEQAAAARDRLEALSRALDDRRRIATICAAGRLVLTRPHPRGREVTVLRHGQLVSVTILPADDPIQPAANAPDDGPEPISGPPPPHLADELRLVARWLDQVAGEAEVVAVSGTLASPAVGGAALQVRYDPGRQRHLVAGEARGRPILRPRALARPLRSRDQGASGLRPQMVRLS